MPFVNHVEFEVTDLKRAAKFYKALLGFKVLIIPRMKYALWWAGKQPGGGLASVKRRHVRHGGTTAVRLAKFMIYRLHRNSNWKLEADRAQVSNA